MSDSMVNGGATDVVAAMRADYVDLDFREPLLQKVRVKCRDRSYRRFVLRGQATWDESGQADLFMGMIQGDETDAVGRSASLDGMTSSALQVDE